MENVGLVRVQTGGTENVGGGGWTVTKLATGIYEAYSTESTFGIYEIFVAVGVDAGETPAGAIVNAAYRVVGNGNDLDDARVRVYTWKDGEPADCGFTALIMRQLQ